MNYLLLEDVPLEKYNTLRLKSMAKLMIFPSNNQAIREICDKFDNKEFINLGMGSNILFSRKYYGEDYIFLNLKLLDDVFFINNKLYAQSGLSLQKLTWYTIEHKIKGFEFLEDIPGTVGGAVIMNAGTHEGNIGQLINKVTYFDINENQIFEREVSKEDFSKRTSYWDNKKIIVLGCYFNIYYGDKLRSLNKIFDFKKNRYGKQPRNYPSAGSVFKNPYKEGKEISAWKLINDVGLRGYKKNGAMISDKHPNFFINIGDATYDDFKYLIDLCKEKVFNKFKINLELEWKVK